MKNGEQTKKLKRDYLTALSVLIFLLLVIWFVFPEITEANPGTVNFTSDVILDLSGFSTTTYIGSGGDCSSLTISGATVGIGGIADSTTFLLKTSEHKIMQLVPSGGTVDLDFSTEYTTNDFVFKWTETSSVSVVHTLATPHPNTDYIVKADGVEVEGSPFNSGAGSEISFTRTGTGEEIYTVLSPRCAEFEEYNVGGWAWSENIGWISFSCQNENAVGEGMDYGVDIEASTGILSGYAWSENVGWVTFERDRTGTPPASPYNGTENYIAKISTEEPHELSGWARALAASSTENGGWSGWINLGWNTGTATGTVSLNNTTKEFEGYGWGGNESNADSQGVIGWLSFNDKDYDGSPGPVDYQVTTTVSFGATVNNLSDSYPCPCDQSRIPNLSWEISQSDDYEYQVQFDDNSDFSSPIIGPNVEGSNATGTFSGTSGSWSPSCTYCCNASPYNNILWNNTYYYQARVRKIGEDNWSNWTSGTEGFTTPVHCYPYSYFLCSYDGETWYDCDQDVSDGKCAATDACQGPIPFLPPAEEEIYVKDFSTCHNPDNSSFDAIYCSSDGYDEESCPTGTITTYYGWDFVNVTSSDGTQDFASSSVTILETGEWGISATTTDTHSPDQDCGHEEGAQSGLPLPDWMEISPY